MRKILVIAVIVLAVVSFALSQTRSNDSRKSGKVERMIMEMERKWADAYVKRDVATLDSILASDFIATGYNPTTSNKAQYMDEAKKSIDKLEAITVEDAKVRVYGNIAISTGRYTSKGRNERGELLSASDRYTTVYVQRGGRWQAVASQVSCSPALQAK